MTPETEPAQEARTVTTTCYMCACRCGIRVHLQGGQIRYIDGNPDHPVNKGVLCAKGSAGIMQHLSPARLTAPLKRVGPRGSGEFVTISWDEALETVTARLRHIRATYLQDWLADPAFPLTWRLQRDRAGSGALGDLGAHIVDLAQYLAGEPVTGVTALTVTFVGERPQIGRAHV